MRAVRVIPCLDVDAGRVVKGVNFVDLRDAGDPVELAARYDAEGADELVFLDITASSDARQTMVDVARRTADGGVRLTVPVTNTGTRAADEVVQVYLDEPLGSDPRPLRTLRAFRRVPVPPGATVEVTFELGPDVLARTAAAHGGVVRLYVGRDADPSRRRLRATVRVATALAAAGWMAAVPLVALYQLGLPASALGDGSDGKISLKSAMAYSSNTAFAQLGVALVHTV